ncbi:UNC93-like protein MFSD11 [Eurosta solidaginis]|uniref:UNC93-like protein MFSD11 n=1 Tax=Eurosta solidaginis TaxID=178769 RepID=UPI003530CF73
MISLDSKLVNILFVSAAFFLIFFAFQTTGDLQKKITEQAQLTIKGGFASLGIYYFVFAAACWFVPAFVVVVGTKWALIAGTTTYVIFIVLFLYPVEWLLYIINITLGAGSAIIYITQGNYIARNSEIEGLTSATRNSGIFLMAQQASYLICATLMYFQYTDDADFEDTDRYIIISILTFICLIGLAMLFFLRLPPSNQAIDESNSMTCAAVFIAVKDNILLLLERDMILLTVIFIYTGVVQAFYSGVYGPALSDTKGLDMESSEVLNLGYIFKGCGGFLGAAIFAVLGDLTIRWGRDVFMYMAGVFHLLAFILIFLNVPNSATFGQSNESSVIHPPNLSVAMTCSFFYGFGASFYTVHIYSMLAGSFMAESTAGFAIYKFFQCLACALSYLYSRFVSLYIQMGILIVILIAAVVCFGIVERGPKEKNRAET